MSGGNERRMRVAAKSELARGVVGLELVPVEPTALPAWAPGSHIDLVRDDALVRQYSLCGRAEEQDRWCVAVLDVENGRGGSAWVHRGLAQGDEVTVKGPRNNFELETAPELFFLAGGIGITPILPMVRQAEADGVPWRLAYGGRSRSSMAFLDELEQYSGCVDVLPQDEAGLLDLEGLLGEEVPGRRVYCCGPEPLLDAVEKVMADRGSEHLHVERFAAKEPVDDSGEAFEIEVSSAGITLRVDEGQSIIDALDEAGIKVEFSCREGTCGTCETGVLAGVPDHRDSVLDDDEKAAGDCMMICVGRCKEGPLVLDL